MSEIKPRKKYIDAVKGFCIILVAFGHAGGIPIFGTYLFACFMQVYFVVAGITYTDKKEETLGQFALKKAKRLLVPYAVYGTALWIADCIFEKLSPPEILRGGVGIIYARHCLFLYQGHQDNLFLLDNMNGPLWFLPAIFISYILFWFIVKSDKKFRPFIAAGYIVINIATSFLPILLPWSLDTVFITADLMYFGFLMKPYLKYIEQLDIKKMFRPRAIVSIVVFAGIYLVCVKLCGGINTSVRIFGSRGVPSIFLYIIVGAVGTVLYLIGFAIAENTSWLSWICKAFAYLGRHTMALLATHRAVFVIVDSVIGALQLDLGYTQTLIKVAVATIIGMILEKAIEKAGSKSEIIKLLG